MLIKFIRNFGCCKILVCAGNYDSCVGQKRDNNFLAMKSKFLGRKRKLALFCPCKVLDADEQKTNAKLNKSVQCFCTVAKKSRMKDYLLKMIISKFF